MRFSSFVERIGGEGSEAWAIHSAASAARARGEDVVMLSIGDPDFATPDMISDAAVAALRDGDTHYAEILGREPLRQAVAAQHRRINGQAVGPQNVIILAGAQNGLFAASLLLTQPGDEVISLEPMYVTYEASIRASGATLVPVSQPASRGFRPDLAAIEAAVTERTRAIFIANPNNPTGVVLTREELEGIADIARRHDLWVVSDEVYAALTFEAPHVGIGALPGMAERTVTIGSLSKSHAMTGWRVGWMVGPEELIRHAEKLALCMLYGLPGFIQTAATKALNEGTQEVARMREIYLRRRDLLYGELSVLPMLKCLKPQAGMFLIADVRETGMSSRDFAWGLYSEMGVAVLDATAFGKSAEGYLRISYTVGEDELLDGCRRIKSYLERLERRPSLVVGA
ncbi:pyridoxal phosphate-dependent aminotransferase [Rhodoligotrophos defluvii]|uniref:pyridoxal phosphate-dependent aminotransferase n=1 Tax=Rhodoligotrophos defluvii TaxID=2561934 RepID=UPI0010C97773|nr:aminotransferase class I/II-fold pyridoxal phosphate-dependent enzyme [Rhodoligotrophos defluvii]